MGAVPSTKKKVDAEKLPRIDPEPEYVVKTRSPMPSTWSLNIMRGRYEDQLKNEAYPFVSRKCIDYVKGLSECEKENGNFWTVFNCQEEFYEMGRCFDHELNVELDKRRRDISKNDEWWWRNLYDENGEVGDQAAWDGSWFLTMKIKDLLGISWRRPVPESQRAHSTKEPPKA